MIFCAVSSVLLQPSEIVFLRPELLRVPALQKDVSSTEMVVMIFFPMVKARVRPYDHRYNFWGLLQFGGLQFPTIFVDTLYMQIHCIYVFCFYIIYLQIHYIAFYFIYIKSWITMTCPKLGIGVSTENLKSLGKMWDGAGSARIASGCLVFPDTPFPKFEENTGKFYAKSSPATDNQKHP